MLIDLSKRQNYEQFPVIFGMELVRSKLINSAELSEGRVGRTEKLSYVYFAAIL
jgi:hypothetical protein